MSKYILSFFLLSSVSHGYVALSPINTNLAHYDSIVLQQDWLDSLSVPPSSNDTTLPDPLHPINDEDNNPITPDVDPNDNTFVESTTTSSNVSLEQINLSLSNIDTDDDVPTLQLILAELQTLNNNQQNGITNNTPGEFNFQESASIQNNFPTKSVIADVTPSGASPNLTFYVPSISGTQTQQTINFEDPKYAAVLNIAKIGLTALVCYGIFRNTWRLSATMLSA